MLLLLVPGVGMGASGVTVENPITSICTRGQYVNRLDTRGTYTPSVSTQGQYVNRVDTRGEIAEC